MELFSFTVQVGGDDRDRHGVIQAEHCEDAVAAMWRYAKAVGESFGVDVYLVAVRRFTPSRVTASGAMRSIECEYDFYRWDDGKIVYGQQYHPKELAA